MKLNLNVALRPFVNQRPLALATLLLALSVAVLTFANVQHLMRALNRHHTLSIRMAENRGEEEAARAATAALQEDLGEREVRLVRRIAKKISSVIETRRLSWSRLFDELARVLPNNVRVVNIVPDVQAKRINLLLTGLAKTNDGKLEFLTHLQQPPFSAARLMGESPGQDGVTEFSINCRYDPDATATPPTSDADDASERPRTADIGTTDAVPTAVQLAAGGGQ